MPVWICATCANHYPDTERPPDACPICSDERQWVPASGQRWTTLAELAANGHKSEIREIEPGLTGIGAKPTVGIGQRAILVKTDEGNLLWEPNGLIDDEAIAFVRSQGGVRVVTASHPHLYGAIVEWADAFDADVLLPEADLQWLPRPTGHLKTWSGTANPFPGVTLVQCGGHFPGSAVVHVAAAADGKGALLSGDTIFVTPGEDRVTFVGSAPNRLPLPERSIRQIVDTVAPYRFERIYGAWWEPAVRANAKSIVESSARRYIQWLRGEVALV